MLIEIILATTIHTVDHPGDEEWNEFNPGIKIQHEQMFTGIYHNSNDKLSAYAGFEFDILPTTLDEKLHLELGVVTGYGADVLPMFRMTYDITEEIEAFVFPIVTIIDDEEIEDIGIGFGISYKFGHSF